MSLRPALFAIDLQRFRDALGADRNVTLEKADRHFVEDCGLNPSDVRRAASKLLGGEMGGHAESDTHVYAIMGMAKGLGFQSEANEVHFGDWPIGAYEEYLELVTPLLAPTGRDIYRHVLSGRPLFGNRIETEWSYYGFLWGQEVRQLLFDLAQVHAAMPALDTRECIHGFPTELRIWLIEIVRRNTDLWIFAQ